MGISILLILFIDSSHPCEVREAPCIVIETYESISAESTTELLEKYSSYIREPPEYDIRYLREVDRFIEHIDCDDDLRRMCFIFEVC